MIYNAGIFFSTNLENLSSVEKNNNKCYNLIEPNQWKKEFIGTFCLQKMRLEKNRKK